MNDSRSSRFMLAQPLLVCSPRRPRASGEVPGFAVVWRASATSPPEPLTSLGDVRLLASGLLSLALMTVNVFDRARLQAMAKVAVIADIEHGWFLPSIS
jgi:hypothetical protein